MRDDDKLVDIGSGLARCGTDLTSNEEKMIMQVLCELQKKLNYFNGRPEFEIEGYNQSVIDDLDYNDGYGMDFIFDKYGLHYQEFDIRRGWVRFNISNLFDLNNFKREKNKFLNTIIKLNKCLPYYQSNNKNTMGIVRIIDDIGFSIDDNIMIIKFNHTLDPIQSVFGKMNSFTRIGLRDMCKLKSHYSIRLFVLICEMKNIGRVKVSINSLYNIFSINKDAKRSKGAVQNAVLIGVNEIEEKLNIKIKHNWDNDFLILTFKTFEYKLNKLNRVSNINKDKKEHNKNIENNESDYNGLDESLLSIYMQGGLE